MADPRASVDPLKLESDDRPREQETVRPPFDPEEFARESDSLIGVDAVSTAPPPPMSAYATATASGTIAAFTIVGPEGVPLLAVARDDLEWFDLQPLARTLLRAVDGQACAADVGARAGVSTEQGMALLHELVREGLVTWRE